jgi:16S rRNA (uracil1498-N3)-methyltransferase
MNLFYATNIQGNIAIFEEEEARHLSVLRKKIGDTLFFTDGKGTFYEGVVANIDKRNCSVSIVNQQVEYRKLPYYLHIAIAPTKNMDRLEWFLEKATEIGISEITLLLCQNSERDKARLDRLEGILLSAMKQSLQCTLPKLNPLTKFNDFIALASASESQKMIAYCNDEQLPHLSATLSQQKHYTIVIGPEGDFSEKEVQTAKNADFQGISLGVNRLRTETAGLFAVSLVAGIIRN